MSTLLVSLKVFLASTNSTPQPTSSWFSFRREFKMQIPSFIPPHRHKNSWFTPHECFTSSPRSFRTHFPIMHCSISSIPTERTDYQVFFRTSFSMNLYCAINLLHMNLSNGFVLICIHNLLVPQDYGYKVYLNIFLHYSF